MLATIALSFLAGVLGGNAIPHFVKGITHESYPNVFGGSPLSNFLAGWFGFVTAAGLLYLARPGSHAVASFTAGMIGVLVMGLFHAVHGAFGRTPEKKG